MENARERTVDEIGRIVLPKDLRALYGIHSGEAVTLVATEDGILLKAKKHPAQEK